MQREEYLELKDHFLARVTHRPYSLNTMVKYWGYSMDYEKEVIYNRQGKIVVVEDDLGLILAQVRTTGDEGYVNYVKNREVLSDTYWWPDMEEDIINYLATLLQETSTNEDKKFKDFSVDIIGPFKESADGNKYIVIITDVFTMWVEAFPIKENILITRGQKIERI